MSLQQLGIRIPETMHKYLKHTALLQNKTQQELVREIIAEYQAKDTHYIDQLNQAGITSLLQVTDQPTQNQGACHDA